MTDTPWEPPLAGDESARTRVGASALTLGLLLKHLAVVEDHMFNVKFRGKPIGSAWSTAGTPATPTSCARRSTAGPARTLVCT